MWDVFVAFNVLAFGGIALFGLSVHTVLWLREPAEQLAEAQAVWGP